MYEVLRFGRYGLLAMYLQGGQGSELEDPGLLIDSLDTIKS